MRATFAATRQYPTATYLSAILRPRKGYVLAVSYEHFYTLSAAPRQIFFPPTREKNVHWPTAAFQHVRLVLLRCPPWCSRFRLVLLHSPPWYSRARAPPLLLLPLPPTLSGFRPRLLLLTTWCSRARLSDTDTLSLSPSPTLTHTHAYTQSLSTLTHTLL